MIGDIFGVITEAITAFANSLSQSVTSITGMFYTPGTAGANGQFTMLGTLLLIAAGVGLVYWAFRLIRGLVRRA